MRPAKRARNLVLTLLGALALSLAGERAVPAENPPLDGVTTLSTERTGSVTTTGSSAARYASLEPVLAGKVAKSFMISGGTPKYPLAPGLGDQPLNLAIRNPNSQVVPISNLSVSVAGTSNAACAPGNFAVTQFRGPYPLDVPAGAATTLTALGVPRGQQPLLRMINSPTVNQNACKKVTVNLAYSGSAGGNRP